MERQTRKKKCTSLVVSLNECSGEKRLVLADPRDLCIQSYLLGFTLKLERSCPPVLKNSDARWRRNVLVLSE